MIWSGVRSSDARVFGVSVYKCPAAIKWLYRHTAVPCDRAWWAMQHRFNPRHRYNIARTGLEPGYYDPDIVILHACMEQLRGYVEAVGGATYFQEWTDGLRKNPDPNAPEGIESRQADHQDEALAIYRWWTKDRPANRKREDELLMAGYSGATWETKPTENPHLSEMIFPTPPADVQAIRDEHRALEESNDADDQAMLHRLVDIRPGLWI